MALRDFFRDTFRIERVTEETVSEAAWQANISEFWSGLTAASGFSAPTLLEKVWVANRCKHMNANAISTMPLRHYGSREPAWVANPDPEWFPNGISDAVYAIIDSLYGWGDAFVYVTNTYADGYPSAWTVLNPEPMTVSVERGRRFYKSGQTPLDERRMVQISRNPGGVRGTSAIKAYASYTNGLLAAADLGRVMMASGAPSSVIKSQRKIDRAQAQAIQDSWVAATASRRGAPAVIGPDLDFEKLGFSAEDLELLSAQKFSAQVIASAFGVPASLINMPIEGGLNYQTPILLLEQWWRTELRTTATRVSFALSSVMLPAGSYVEFDPYKFLAPSFKELVESYTALVEAGIMSVEEARTVVLGLPPSESQADALLDLSTPPSAGASPAQSNGSVVSLRPTTATSSI
jgi:HK97 family phage portal protein